MAQINKYLTLHQNLVIDYLKKGYYIEVFTDYSFTETIRSLTDGNGNDVMAIKHSTIVALLKRGLIEEKGSWTPSVYTDIQKFYIKNHITKNAIF
jgi:hypothetical protein